MKKPTKAAVEAALSAYQLPTAETGQTEEMQEFISLLTQVPELHGRIQGIGAGLYFFSTGGPMVPPSPEEYPSWLQEANPEFIGKVFQFCSMFFWIGWHARGAQEDAEKMEKMLQ